jgi:hypothetical protein
MVFKRRDLDGGGENWRPNSGFPFFAGGRTSMFQVAWETANAQELTD